MTNSTIELEGGGEAFWLDDRTIGLVAEGRSATTHPLYDGKDEGKAQRLISLDIKSSLLDGSQIAIGSFPPAINGTNFTYSPSSNTLLFTAYTYADQDLSTVSAQDVEREEAKKEDGSNYMVFESTYTRNWDTWTPSGSKRSSIFCVWLGKEQNSTKWRMGQSFVSVLKGLNHVRRSSYPTRC